MQSSWFEMTMTFFGYRSQARVLWPWMAILDCATKKGGKKNIPVHPFFMKITRSRNSWTKRPLNQGQKSCSRSENGECVLYNLQRLCEVERPICLYTLLNIWYFNIITWRLSVYFTLKLLHLKHFKGGGSSLSGLGVTGHYTYLSVLTFQRRRQ